MVVPQNEKEPDDTVEIIVRPNINVYGLFLRNYWDLIVVTSCAISN